ncbi:FtsB family cell division protein [Desulfatiferula olefinivorans]
MSPFKKIVLALSGFGLLVLALVIVFRENGLLDLRARRQQLARAVSENEALEQKNMALYHEVRRLKHDDVYLDHVARKELGMVKHDEIIIRFHSDKKK